ncbi:hypothetical protein ACOME3_002266 [Neoechinorhynchus agilis]
MKLRRQRRFTKKRDALDDCLDEIMVDFQALLLKDNHSIVNNSRRKRRSFISRRGKKGRKFDIPRANFVRTLRSTVEVLHREKMRFTLAAVNCLQYALEREMEFLFAVSNQFTKHAKRKTLMCNDIALYLATLDHFKL